MPEPVIRRARPEERRTALRLCLTTAGQSPGDLEQQVNGFLEYTRALHLACDSMFVAEAHGRPIAACCWMAWPGRTGMISAGPGGSPPLEATLVKLLAQAVEASPARDIPLHQALLPPSDKALRAAFLGAGFAELSVLQYLEKALTPDDVPVRPLPGWSEPGCQIEPFDENKVQDWHSLILATYERSLDCPELTGLRQIDDIIAGHRGAGIFTPDRWLMLRHQSRPAAVVMLCENPLRPALEIVYTGVHPGFRGRGLGRYMVGLALSLAFRGGFPAVTLAVDERNRPARAIYQAAGFEYAGARRALIRPQTASTS